MTTSSVPKPTIAFFGSTGGCSIVVLAGALKDGYKTSALVRSATKLQALLEARAVAKEVIASNCTIVEGNIRDPTAVTRTLTAFEGGRVADIIMSGIGSLPKPRWEGWTFKLMEDAHVCEDAMEAIVASLREYHKSTASASRPHIISISTTGIDSRSPGDVPLLFVPLYHVALATPHEDKRKMERKVVEGTLGSEPVFSSFALVRPSLLTDGETLGLDKVRVGVVDGAPIIDKSKESAANGTPAVGYTISRNDVGNWIFQKLLKELDSARETY
ncbi:hypothetical protein HDU93_001753, partial [Gonapodya sp. JEL0774]